MLYEVLIWPCLGLQELPLTSQSTKSVGVSPTATTAASLIAISAAVEPGSVDTLHNEKYVLHDYRNVHISGGKYVRMYSLMKVAV